MAHPVIDEARIRELVRRVVHRTLGRVPRSATGDRRPMITQLEVDRVPPLGEFRVPAGALVTPLARQAAMERRVLLVEGEAEGAPAIAPAASEGAPAKSKTVAIGADHGGFELKQALAGYLRTRGYAVIDCGTDSADAVDYPDFAVAVARQVAEGRAWRGIVIDGAGIGSCMAANKVPGVRAAMCYDRATADNSREHNDANVLTLGARMIAPELARQIVRLWLETPAGGGRHARRVAKITEIERQFLRPATSP